MDPAAKMQELRETAGEYFTSFEEIQKSVSKMDADMRTAAKAMQFEKAAELRDRIKRLKILNLGL